MLTAHKGFSDILPGEVEKWQFVEAKARKIFENYGFLEIKTPIAEKTELFARSIGEATDIVEKEMYTFPDRKGELITLRPEATASVARAYIEHRLYESKRVVKLYCIGPMFRYERPQKGRYRQFHQINVEALGTADPAIDAEIMGMLNHFFNETNITDIELQINSLGCLECRVEYRQKLIRFLSNNTSDLCEDCNRRLKTNPLRTFDCKNKVCHAITSTAPRISEYICNGCAENFEDVKRSLEQLHVQYKVNPRLVRGLDYYTRITFEVVTDKLGAQNAVAAGGRYDGLIRELGGPDTPGLGFAIGLERLISLVPKENDFSGSPFLFIASLGIRAKEKAFQLANSFRMTGIKTEIDYDGRSLKSQLRWANKLNARFVVIIGDDELMSGKVILKDMEGKEQEEVELEKIVDEIQSRKQHLVAETS